MTPETTGRYRWNRTSAPLTGLTAAACQRLSFLPQVILRFTDFKLDGTGYGDYVKVYDGLEENPHRLLRVLTAFDSRAPVTVVSSSGQLRVHFYADKINAARGFNVTYQVLHSRRYAGVADRMRF